MTERSIFAAALDIADAQQRAAYLDEACRDQPDVRQHIEELLAAQEKLGSFLDHPAAGNGTALHASAEGPGSRVGPYKLLQVIGEGGMGIVYMAEQVEPVRRKVALKIIKPGMDSKQVVARFEAERQALALMDHPNIARVLDGGTTESGRPYFVMELVHGVPLTRFCDENRLSPRQRLALFVPVCHAIQHAHTKGIIHRDIKPSNILVTMYDDKPVPKVIDFGVAKATEQPLTERTLFTQFGTMVGTFEYMSPEQAEMNAFGVDTRSDVYSLGVLLYELLTGSTPLERQRLRAAGYGEIVRLIKEEEPLRPSLRLSTAGEALAAISQKRGTEPGKLAKLVRHELDWIVMRCLEKDRSRRYETANGLARDVERYLHEEPVEACPPAALYRLRKFARKNRTALSLAAIIGGLLVLATVVSTWLAMRATHAEGRAREEREAAIEAESRAVADRDGARDANAKLRAAQRELRWSLYVSDMNLGKLHLSGQAVDQAAARLKRHVPGPGEPDLRGFEWYWLARSSHTSVQSLPAHVGSVYSIDFNRDSSRMVTSGRPAGVWVWDMKTREPIHKLNGHTAAVWSAVFSPDGSRIASASADKTVRLWDARTGKFLKALEGHEDKVYTVRWHPEGKHLVSAGHESVVRVWDIEAGKAVREVKHEKGMVPTACISPDGKTLATGGEDGTIRLWDFATGTHQATWKEHTKTVRELSISRNGKHLLSASWDGSVKVWDVKSDKPRASYSYVGGAQTAAFSPDGAQIAFSGWAAIVILREWEANRSTRPLRQHVSLVAAVAFTPDGRYLASGGEDGTVKLWDYHQSRPAYEAWPEEQERHKGAIGALAVGRHGQRIVTTSADGTGRLWDGRGQSLVREWQTGNKRPIVQCVALDDERGRVAALTSEGVTVWGTSKGERQHEVQLPEEERARVVAFHPNQRDVLAIGSNYGKVWLWDLATGKARLSWGTNQLRPSWSPGQGAVLALAFTPDGSRVITGNGYGAQVWDTASGKLVHHLVGHSASVGSVACSPDGKTLATGSMDRQVKLWDARTGKCLRTLEGHAYLVLSLAFSPDGKRLASVGMDKRIRLWDTASGANVLTLFIFRGKDDKFVGLKSLAFSPDGSRLFAGGEDGAIHVWDASPVRVGP